MQFMQFEFSSVLVISCLAKATPLDPQHQMYGMHWHMEKGSGLTAVQQFAEKLQIKKAKDDIVHVHDQFLKAFGSCKISATYCTFFCVWNADMTNQMLPACHSLWCAPLGESRCHRLVSTQCS